MNVKLLLSLEFLVSPPFGAMTTIDVGRSDGCTKKVLEGSTTSCDNVVQIWKSSRAMVINVKRATFEL